MDLVSSLERGLNTPIGENGLTLSGGQRQRVALARALYRNPEVLLLDEVTNHLDERSKTELLRALQSRSKNKNITIILASHDTTARKYATRILQLSASKIQESIRYEIKQV
jgi:ATP-binding cassette subfamily B protein